VHTKKTRPERGRGPPQGPGGSQLRGSPGRCGSGSSTDVHGANHGDTRCGLLVEKDIIFNKYIDSSVKKSTSLDHVCGLGACTQGAPGTRDPTPGGARALGFEVNTEFTKCICISCAPASFRFPPRPTCYPLGRMKLRYSTFKIDARSRAHDCSCYQLDCPRSTSTMKARAGILKKQGPSCPCPSP